MFRITEACTACDACVDACPIGAITPGEPIYVIDPETCCDFESCLVMCPEDAIVFVEEDSTEADARIASRPTPS